MRRSPAPSSASTARSSSSSRSRSSSCSGFVGLALDGGSTFAQRRDEQTAADLAALAGGERLPDQRQRAGRDRPGPLGGGDQRLSRTASAGTTRRRGDRHVERRRRSPSPISAEHHNRFLGVIGMPTWTVSVEATALAGFPDTAYGASPFIFSARRVRATTARPLYQIADRLRRDERRRPDEPARLRLDQLRDRQRQHQRGELDHRRDRSSSTRRLTSASTSASTTTATTPPSSATCNTYLSGKDLPVAIVDSNGNFMGWAIFHVNSACGGSDKHVNGYFLSSFESARLAITALRRERLPALPRAPTS